MYQFKSRPKQLDDSSSSPRIGADGKPRSNADKRNAVKIALESFPKLSDRELAKICAVTHPFVAGERSKQLVTVTSSPRIGADGKTRKMPVKPEFTVRDLGNGTLVKEPAAAGEHYVAQNGTVDFCLSMFATRISLWR